MNGREANRLTGLYFYKIGQQDANINWRKKIHYIISTMLTNGVSVSIIENALNRDAEHFEDIVRAALNQDNLIQQGAFYYHPYLQVAPPAPTITINEDGTFTESYVDEQFYLRIKARFSFEDAINYYYYRFEEQSLNMKRDLGSIKYLYQNSIIPMVKIMKSNDEELNELDLLLFTIDAAFNMVKGDSNLSLYNGILGLGDFIQEGLHLYREKLNFCKMNELTHVY